VRYINRDAAALLLSRSAATGEGGGGLAFIDVRRHDERTLYGSIPRAQHVPGALPGPSLQSMTRGPHTCISLLPHPVAAACTVAAAVADCAAQWTSCRRRCS
jgi:hypothetical protein